MIDFRNNSLIQVIHLHSCANMLQSRRATARFNRLKELSAAMTPIRIVKGLEVPISWELEQVVTPANELTSVAVLGADYAALRPALLVAEGDRVKLGRMPLPAGQP